MKYEILTDRFEWRSDHEVKKYRISSGGYDIKNGSNYVSFKTVDGVFHKVPLCKIDDIRSW